MTRFIMSQRASKSLIGHQPRQVLGATFMVSQQTLSFLFFILMNTRETSRDRKMRNAHEISDLKAGDFSQVGHRYLDHSVPPNLQGPEAITSDVQGGTSLF